MSECHRSGASTAGTHRAQSAEGPQNTPHNPDFQFIHYQEQICVSPRALRPLGRCGNQSFADIAVCFGAAECVRDCGLHRPEACASPTAQPGSGHRDAGCQPLTFPLYSHLGMGAPPRAVCRIKSSLSV